jgi:hypothetical protein
MSSRVNPRVVYTLFSALIILFGTILAIYYAQGNFRITKEGYLPEAGLLKTNSSPTGAEVYINGKLVGVTEETIDLEPGKYRVRLFKEGYSPWEKELTLEKGFVTLTDALLFPQVPSLTPLTFTGVLNVLPSPDGQKLVYYTSSASATTKNGLYVLELNNNLLSLQKTARQVSDNALGFDLPLADLIWSPDSTQLMLLTQNNELLLEQDRFQTLSTLADIGFQRKTILSQWEEEMYIRERQYFKEFPEEIVAMATQSAKNVYLSPDKKKLLYTATKPTLLEEELIPPVPAANTQPQQRQLEPGGIYVYDREEDRNFLVGRESDFTTGAKTIATHSRPTTGTNPLGDEANPSLTASISARQKQLLATDLSNPSPLTLQSSPSAFTRLQTASTAAELATAFTVYHTTLYAPTFQWFPDSKHLIFTTPDQIHVMEYDGTNDSVVYSGPFAHNFVYPWPDGSKLIILTSFSPTSPLNLYAVDLK